MATTIYNSTKLRLLNGDLDLDGDTIRVALVSDNTAYTPDIDNEEYVADVLDGGTTAEEFGGSGYTRKDLANGAVTQDDTDDEAEWDADNVSWSAIDGDTIQWALVYKEVGGDDTTPEDDPLIAAVDSADFPLTANGGEINLEWDAEGILKLG